jgi:hypothetical protein
MWWKVCWHVPVLMVGLAAAAAAAAAAGMAL